MTAGRRASSQRRMTAGCVGVAVVIAILVLLLRTGGSGKVSEIVVQGNERYADEEIENMAGIRRGDKLKALDENAVRRALEKKNAVELVGFSVDGDTVTLTVRERQVRASVSSAGIVLLIDSDGTILERRDAMTEDVPVRVSGLDLMIDVKGEKVESEKSGQMETVRRVLDAMAAQGLSDKMSELDVKDSYNLYMVTKTGLQIVLGDDEDLPEKMAWADAVFRELTAQGITRGVLDVSTGKNAAYADR